MVPHDHTTDLWMNPACLPLCIGALVLSACGQQHDGRLASDVTIVDNAAPASLTDVPGDADRGRTIFTSRDEGHCVLCHQIEGLNAEFQGNVGPSLTGIGNRLTAGQIRYRIIDAQRIWPETVMPAYYRARGLRQVGREFEGKPALSAQQIEDLVAFLEAQTS